MERKPPERSKKNNTCYCKAAEQFLIPPPSVRNHIIHEASEQLKGSCLSSTENQPQKLLWLSLNLKEKKKKLQKDQRSNYLPSNLTSFSRTKLKNRRKTPTHNVKFYLQGTIHSIQHPIKINQVRTCLVVLQLRFHPHFHRKGHKVQSLIEKLRSHILHPRHGQKYIF